MLSALYVKRFHWSAAEATSKSQECFPVPGANGSLNYYPGSDKIIIFGRTEAWVLLQLLLLLLGIVAVVATPQTSAHQTLSVSLSIPGEVGETSAYSAMHSRVRQALNN